MSNDDPYNFTRESQKKMYLALQEISKYASPEEIQLQHDEDTQAHEDDDDYCPLDIDEEIGYAYENVIWCAERALSGLEKVR